jgi:deoxyribodipyrimidine photo-lyase
VSQSQKFDPQGRFIRRYLPQLAGLPDAALHAPWLAPAVELAAAGVELDRDYPRPIVDHAVAREKTLQRYAVVKKQSPA